MRFRIFPEGLRFSDPNIHGFSLLELLVVIAIMMILAALTTPAISSLQRSYNLTRAGALVQDNLNLARQLAITRNASIIVSICSTTNEAGQVGFNTLLLNRLRADGVLEQVVKLLKFPSGFAISSNADWTSLMDLAGTNVALPSGSVSCRQIRFDASGSTDLAASGKWFLTIHHASEANPKANFITLAIEPVTGRTFSYQP